MKDAPEAGVTGSRLTNKSTSHQNNPVVADTLLVDAGSCPICGAAAHVLVDVVLSADRDRVDRFRCAGCRSALDLTEPVGASDEEVREAVEQVEEGSA